MKLKAAEYEKKVWWSDQDKCFVGEVVGLDGAMTDGETEEECRENLDDVTKLVIECSVGDWIDQEPGQTKMLVSMPDEVYEGFSKIWRKRFEQLEEEESTDIHSLMVQALTEYVERNP